MPRPIYKPHRRGIAFLATGILLARSGGEKMMTSEHVAALKAKHADIENRIDVEEHRPHPDDTRITELKRQKLRLKDEIAQLKP
jgi:hypothetical protein